MQNTCSLPTHTRTYTYVSACFITNNNNGAYRQWLPPHDSQLRQRRAILKRDIINTARLKMFPFGRDTAVVTRTALLLLRLPFVYYVTHVRAHARFTASVVTHGRFRPVSGRSGRARIRPAYLTGKIRRTADLV